jgi:ATP-binding cassette subfamily B protein/ATP-binding cassette subfamily C protein
MNLGELTTLLKKCIFLFDGRFKKGFIYIIFLTIILSFVELIGIGIFIPLFLLLLEPNNKFILEIKNLHPFLEQNYIFCTIFIIFIIFLGKFFLSLYINLKSNKYIFTLYEYITKKFFNFYISQDYNYFHKKNTSEITRNIYSEMGILANQIVFNSMQLIKNSFLILFTFIFLFYFDWAITTIVSVIFLMFTYFYLKFFKKKLLIIGESIKNQSYEVLNDLSEIFLSIKEIKIFGLENFSTHRFNNNFMRLSFNKRESLIFSFLPKIFLEFMSVILMLGIIIFLLIMEISGNYIMIKLGIYAIAVIRITPAFVSIASSIQGISLFIPSLDNINNELIKMENLKVNENFNNIKLNNIQKIDKIESIEFKNVCFSYNKDKSILKNINFSLKKGSLIALVGDSGSGKTTLADMMCGLVFPDSGIIKINEENSSRDINKELRKNIGYVTQSNFFFDDTIKANIIFGTVYNKDKENELLKKIISDSQIFSFIKELPDGLDTKIGQGGISLSGGQKQRISIARSLYRCPSILILDEATNALDEKNEEKIFEIIKIIKKEIIVILISHKKDLINHCDIVYELKDAKLYKKDLIY